MIRFGNLGFSYSKTPVLSNMDFTLEKGNIYGLLGGNGVGKTTLLKLISGLLKPTVGECTMDGAHPSHRDPDVMENLYFVPENPAFADVIVEKDIKKIGAFYPNFKIEDFYSYMKIFEVDPTKKYTELSFGQQKKALLSLGFALNTPYLFLDEPTNGLDIPSKSQFRKVVASISTEDKTIVISTHQVRDLENLIDPIIILEKNEVLLKASIQEIEEKMFFFVDTKIDEFAYYSEPALGGYLQVVKNESNLESKVNVEILFNAVMNNKNEIKEIFIK